MDIMLTLTSNSSRDRRTSSRGMRPGTASRTMPAWTPEAGLPMPVNNALGRSNFEAWFVDVLASLYETRSAGFAVMTLTLPLLERYLRQRCGLGAERSVNDAFRQQLVSLFPPIVTRTNAGRFWSIYRHGMLHQVSPSRSQGGAALPHGFLSQDIAGPVRIDPDGAFCVHPMLFSKRVVEAIRSDFATFSGTAGGAPPLPLVIQIGALLGPALCASSADRDQ